MTELTPLTALGGASARITSHGALTLREDPGLALASLALPRGGDVPSPFGLTLPSPGGYVSVGDISAVWAGPEQWLLAVPGQAGTDFAATLAHEVPGGRITEQTDGFAAMELAGDATAVAAALERLVNLPPEMVAPGRGTRTGIHHMSVFVLRPAPDRLVLLGMRSAAGSLWHVLEEVVRRLAVSP